MRHVQARFANLLRKIDVAVHNARFGGSRHAAQPQTCLLYTSRCV